MWDAAVTDNRKKKQRKKTKPLSNFQVSLFEWVDIFFIYTTNNAGIMRIENNRKKKISAANSK